MKVTKLFRDAVSITEVVEEVEVTRHKGEIGRAHV